MRHVKWLTLAIALVSMSLIGLGAKAQISVTPTNNDLDIIEGETFGPETITVKVPAGSGATTVDVYLLADTTGSMGLVINAVKAGGAQVVDDLVAALPDVDLAFGVGNYKDFPYDPYAFQHQLDITSDTVAAKAAVANWIAGGGYDGSEGQFFALDRIGNDIDPGDGTIGWRPGAEKIIVWFGDAPGHDPICDAISGLGVDITEATVTQVLADGGYSVLAISTVTGYPNGLDDDPTLSANDYAGFCMIGGTAGQATRIATATGGEAVSGIDASSIVAKIIELVETAVLTIDELALVPTDSISALVQSISPESYIDLTTEVEKTYDYAVTFGCPIGTLGEFSGALEVQADGSTEARKTVAISCLPANSPPIAVCTDVTVPADDLCQANANVDGGSTDPDGDPITLVQSPDGPYPLGETQVTLTVTDDSGASDSCTATVTVVDDTPPVVSCSVSRLGGIDKDDDDYGDDDGGSLIEYGGELLVNFSATDNCEAVTSPLVSASVDIGCAMIPIEDGQIIDVECDDDCEYEFDDGVLETESKSTVVVVISTDGAGNTTESECANLCPKMKREKKSRDHDD